MTSCHMDGELGAYVLRALEPDEAALVESHLSECESCRAEASELSSTASMLSLLRTEDLEEFEDPVAGAERPRRPRRTLMLVVVAALTATTASTTAVLERDHLAPQRPTATQVSGPADAAQATVAMSPLQTATRLHVHLTGVPPDGWCSLVAHSRSGRTETAATWLADDHGTADVTGTTAIPANRLSELVVKTQAGHVLMRIPMNDARSTGRATIPRRN
jgi:hypothetical protein